MKTFLSLATRALIGTGTALLVVGCQSEIRGAGQTLSSLNATTQSGTVLSGTATSPATTAEVLSGDQYWDSTGTLKTGSMPFGNDFTAANGALIFAVPAGYYDGIKTATAADSNLLASNIASGVSIFGVTGTAGLAPATCTANGQSSCVANASFLAAAPQGNWNMNTTAFPGAGYYTGLTSTLTTTNVCTGTNIFGAAGVAICETGTTVSPAVAANILSGDEAWSSTGTKITGTMANQGALDASATFPGAGYYNGTVTNLPTASEIASGDTILGVAGNYTGSFGANTGSNASRDIATAQITLQSEVSTHAGSGGTPTLPAGYRDVSDITKDDDGYNNTDADATCASDGSGCTPVISVTAAQHAAFVDCGTTQTSISARVADCATQNGADATWIGSTDSNGGQGSWKMVTHQGANKEVWQDQRTMLLWSSLVAPSTINDNWCRADGNAQSGDPSNYCNSTTYQPEYPTAESECAEPVGANPVPGWCSNGTAYSSAAGCTGAGGTWTANTDNFGAGTYSAAKGGMGANSATLKVRWRLPAIHDYEQAEIDGIRSVMPDMGAFSAGYEWSASLVSSLRFYAWIFVGSYGGVGFSDRSDTDAVRCVGR
jgi:hypothetical protein